MSNTRQGEIQPWDTIRVPLVFDQTSRVADYSNPGVYAVAGLAIAGDAIAGTQAASGKDKRLINFIPEVINQPLTSTAVQGDNIFYITKRPGFAVNSTPAAGSAGYDVHVWLGTGNAEVISAFGSHIYKNTTDLGSLGVGVTATSITETFVGTIPTIVITGSNSSMWYYQSGGSITQVDSAYFPGTCPTPGLGLTLAGAPVHIDGYTFIAVTTGVIYNSDSGSITGWSSGSVTNQNAAISPSTAIGLGRYKNTLMLFKQEAIEFWQDSGNSPGSPLGRMDMAFIKVGALNANCIVNVQDTTVWAATSDKGGVAIYAMQNYSPVKISNTNIELQLSQVNISGISMSTCKIRGKTFIFVQSANSIPVTTFVYSMEEQVWHEWRSGSNIYWYKLSGNSSGNMTVYGVSNNLTGGKVFVLDPTAPVYSDDGNNYTSTFQSSPMDANTENWKRCHKFKVICDRASSTSNLTISWSDDDYNSYKGSITLDLSQVRAMIPNLGSFRRRAFRGDHTSPIACRIEAIELDLSQNDH